MVTRGKQAKSRAAAETERRGTQQGEATVRPHGKPWEGGGNDRPAWLIKPGHQVTEVWKAYLTAVRLQELAILRIEHAVSS